RAFAAYWEVPAGEETAKNGQWKTGPGNALFAKLEEELGSIPFVAEDLGEVNDAVFDLRDAFAMPGMKILQFAFGEDFPSSDYIPHNYTPNFFVYPGTHDNNTVLGWYQGEADEGVRQRINKYAGREVTEGEIPHFFCRTAMGSVARTAILPLQDLLQLDGSARMNKPASAEGNWGWRLMPGQLHNSAKRSLSEWTILFNRD
ncbi:MAG TPA: 4-alpha-glucanotransferase, partial [Flavisolibacter sp.]